MVLGPAYCVASVGSGCLGVPFSDDIIDLRVSVLSV